MNDGDLRKIRNDIQDLEEDINRLQTKMLKLKNDLYEKQRLLRSLQIPAIREG